MALSAHHKLISAASSSFLDRDTGLNHWSITLMSLFASSLVFIANFACLTSNSNFSTTWTVSGHIGIFWTSLPPPFQNARLMCLCRSDVWIPWRSIDKASAVSTSIQTRLSGESIWTVQPRNAVTLAVFKPVRLSRCLRTPMSNLTALRSTRCSNAHWTRIARWNLLEQSTSPDTRGMSFCGIVEDLMTSISILTKWFTFWCLCR